MPFDSRPTKPDLSLESLIRWLEQQPPEREYNWVPTSECLLTQYAKHHGVSYWRVGQALMDESDEPPGDVALREPHTFGAALERARALLAEREAGDG